MPLSAATLVPALQALVASFEAAQDEPGVLLAAVHGLAALGIPDAAAWTTGLEVVRVVATGRLSDREEPPRPGGAPAAGGLYARACGAPGRRDGVIAALLPDGAEEARSFDLVVDLASAALRRVERAREAQTAAARIAAERHRTRALIEQSPMTIAIRSGPDHVLEMANERYLRMVGLGRDLFGRPGRESLPEVAAQGFFDVLDRVYTTGEAFTGHEVRCLFDRTGEGHLAEGWFTYTWAPLRDAEGQIVGTAMHAVDVTEQVQARLESEAALVRLQHLATEASAGRPWACGAGARTGEGPSPGAGSVEVAPIHGKGTILVVDDEPEVRSTARLLLEYVGYRVVEAEDGATALRLLAKGDPAVDVVLLDLTMPAMGGEETLARIRAAYPRLPVVVSSGYDHNGVMVSLPEGGPTAFLQKPYSVHELSERIKAARRGAAALDGSS